LRFDEPPFPHAPWAIRNSETLMPLSDPFGWLEVDHIAELLAEAHPRRDPLTVKFTELRGLIESLPGFKEEPGHPVNEKILETVQMKWYEEYQDIKGEEED